MINRDNFGDRFRNRLPSHRDEPLRMGPTNQMCIKELRTKSIEERVNVSEQEDIPCETPDGKK